MLQDKAASDSMEPTLKLMHVNRLIRTAVKLVKGVELRQTGNSFEIIVLSGILWFKVGLSSIVLEAYIVATHISPLCSDHCAHDLQPNVLLCHGSFAQQLCPCGSGGYEFHSFCTCFHCSCHMLCLHISFL